MTTFELVEPLPPETATDIAEIVARATSFKITDPESYRTACSFLQGIKSLQKAITDFFSPHKRKAKAVHDGLCADERLKLAPVAEAEAIIKRAIGRYAEEQERIEREIQKRKQAEAQRLEEERALQEAVDEEDAGNDALAAAIMNEPIEAPVVARQMPVKVDGIVTREIWSAELFSKMSVATYVIAHPEFAELIDVNMTAANGLARSLKGAMKIPGLRAVSSKNVAVRGLR